VHVFIKRGLFTLLVVALTACSNGVAGYTTPAAASAAAPEAASIDQILDSAPEVSGGHEVFRPLAMHPNANTPAILINFVSDGPAQNGVPCIGCVYGVSTGDDVGLTGPSSYVPTGATWQYSISFTDIHYKGKCKLAWAITTSKKTLDSFSASLNLPASVEGGFVLYAQNRSRPKYSGPATLTGKATCGSEHPSLKAPLQFE
jgi:hypothetical protein